MIHKAIFALLCLFVYQAYSQDSDYFKENYLRYDNHIYNDSIFSALIHKEGWVLSYPIIYLNGADAIELEFDDLSNEIQNYSYTVVHCNANWQPSDIMEGDYIDGNYDEQIIDYAYSFNTLRSYIHYSLKIPNENMKFKISGNYILKVFKDFDQENLVITKRFCVVEEKVVIDAKIKQATAIDKRNTSQEIDFTLTAAGIKITDPFSDIKVTITQNNRWDNASTNLKPLNFRENQLFYDYEEGNVFEGGSECRHFDIKSIRYQSDRIVNIVFKDKDHHVELLPDEPRMFKEYFFRQDLNGKYMPEIQEGEDNNTEPDYVWVYFTLPYEAPFIDGNVYVFGGLSDWTTTKRNQMVYDFETKSYRLRMLLKQGYYNYEYALLTDGSTVIDNTFLEGSHYETENDYLIYVYHRDISERFDRLVGVEIINTLRNE